MRIYYATTNKGKVQSLQRVLGPIGVTVEQAPLDIPEPRSSDVQEIAREKIRYAYERIGQPVAALDAGFYIHALGGFPRAYVNFALETIDLDGILKLATGTDRRCEFRDCLAYQDSTIAEPACFLSYARGTLAAEPRGDVQPHHWSRLSRIFIPDGHQKTLAEMTLAEYESWRRTAREEESSSRQFAAWLSARHGAE